VFLSLLPPIIEFIRHRSGKRSDVIDKSIDVIEDDKAVL